MKLPTSVDKLQIALYPDPVLRLVCKPVEAFDDQLAALVERMKHLLREAHGVGLAAPQVGVPIRLFICCPTGEDDDLTVWVNSQLSDMQGAEEGEEGCLSIPGVTVPKRRATQACIRGFDFAGNPISAEITGLTARVCQHESDHLDGVLVIDAMPELAELANRKTIKQLEADYAAAMRRRRPSSRK